MPIDYKSSGVNIDEGNRFVSVIKKLVENTHSKSVIGGIGGFAGFFDLKDFSHYKEPVLVSSTDGVGTKLKIAIDTDILDTVGIDLVAMSVNDLVVTGAKPLFFLDYIATGKLCPEKMVQVVKGISDGCKQAGISLLGGETAEMPGMYNGEDFDLAGFAVGILDKANAITGEGIQEGDVLFGLPSSGFHSNGYSLIRKALFDNKKLPHETVIDGENIAELMLTPTKIYVKTVLSVIEAGIKVKGMVHITGGGFYDNIPRVLPNGLSAIIDKNSFPPNKSIDIFRNLAKINEKELFRVFNMGIGYIIAVSKETSKKLEQHLNSINEEYYIVGNVVKSTTNDCVLIKGIDI